MSSWKFSWFENELLVKQKFCVHAIVSHENLAWKLIWTTIFSMTKSILYLKLFVTQHFLEHFFLWSMILFDAKFLEPTICWTQNHLGDPKKFWPKMFWNPHFLTQNDFGLLFGLLGGQYFFYPIFFLDKVFVRLIFLSKFCWTPNFFEPKFFE